jgi:serine/threonine protein kinase
VAETRQIIDGRYGLLRRLGQGGMGEVWAAHDFRLGRAVAVKLLSRVGDPVAEGMFVREAKAVALFNHPNVVTIHDAGGGAEGEPMYLVTEVLEGHDLAHLPGGVPVPVGDVLEWAAQVCEVLEAAREASLVHRDIKPANVFLTREGRVKVLDFGLARLYEAVTATASATIGTRAYMAPERWRGRVGNHRGDLYSLGCVLYELLTGVAPFAHHDATGQMYAHLHEQPRPPVEHRPDIPPHLDALVLDLLAKNPDDRPRDAATTRARLRPLAGALHGLDTALNGTSRHAPGNQTPPDGTPLSPVSPPGRGLPRRKVLVAAAVTAAVIAGGVVAIQNMPSVGDSPSGNTSRSSGPESTPSPAANTSRSSGPEPTPSPSGNTPRASEPSSAQAQGGVNGECGPLLCVYTAHAGRYVEDITVKSKDGQPGEMHAWWGEYKSDYQNKVRGYWKPNQKQTDPGAKLVCGEMLRNGKRVEFHCVDLDQ